MPFRKLLIGGGGSLAAPPMFPLNGVINCNWDSVNNKANILEIDSEDDSKINLLASVNNPLEMNFAYGINDGKPRGLFKSIQENQALDISSYAGKTVQIIASCADVNADPVIGINEIYNSASWQENDNIMPVMLSAEQDGFVITAAGTYSSYFEYMAFDNNLDTHWRHQTSATWIKVQLPFGFPLSGIKARRYGTNNHYCTKVEGSLDDVTYTELWTGNVSLSSSAFSSIALGVGVPYKYYKISFAQGGSYPDTSEIQLVEADLCKYDKANHVVKNLSNETIYQINLGYAVVDSEGSVTTLGDYIDLTPNAPGGMKSE